MLIINSAVARIAYLSSDVIISVQPAESVETDFSPHLHNYIGRKDKSLVAACESGIPEVGMLILFSDTV